MIRAEKQVQLVPTRSNVTISLAIDRDSLAASMRGLDRRVSMPASLSQITYGEAKKISRRSDVQAEHRNVGPSAEAMTRFLDEAASEDNLVSSCAGVAT